MAKSKSKKNKEKEAKEKKRRQFITIGVSILIVVLVATGTFFLIKKSQENSLLSKYAAVISKEDVREKVLGYKPQVTNPRVLADPYNFSDSFAVEDLEKDDGELVAKEAILIIDNPSYNKNKEKIPSNASMLLIVDNGLNVISLTPFNPTYFDFEIEFDKYFEEYKGKSAESIIKQVDGIYTGESNDALVIKNKVKEALSLFYIETYGREKFTSLGATGYVFSEKGTKVTPVSGNDVNGVPFNLEDFKNYKLVIIGGNPGCGSCVESVSKLGEVFKQYDLSNVKFIVLSFADTKEELAKLTKSLPAETIGVIDNSRELATKLKVNSSPYIALVDKDLTLFFRGPAEPMKDTLDNIKEFLIK
jgi:hypothetical protein